MNETNKQIIYKLFFDKYFYKVKTKPELVELAKGFFAYQFYDERSQNIIRLPAQNTTVMEEENV